jgi:hypothetical protein
MVLACWAWDWRYGDVRYSTENRIYLPRVMNMLYTCRQAINYLQTLHPSALKLGKAVAGNTLNV